MIRGAWEQNKGWIIAGISAALILFMMQILHFFDLADAYWTRGCFELRQSLHLQGKSSSSVVLVTVTTKSIKTMGQWPWKRSVWGTLTGKLEKAGAAVIGYDIDFSTPADGDSPFASSVKKNVILPIWFEYAEEGKADLQTPPIRAGFPSPLLLLKSSQGFVNIETDSLGVRKVMMETKFRGKTYPAFALEAYRMYEGLSEDSSARVPLDEDGALWINYKTPDFQEVPAQAILNPKFSDWNLFRNKIVLIGVTSPLGQDIKITPLGAMSGLAIQAEILNNLLQHSYIAPLNPWLDLLFLLLLGASLGAFVPRYPWKVFLPWTGGALVALPLVCFHAMTILGVIVEVFAPTLLVLGMTGAVVMAQSLQADKALITKLDEIKMMNQVSCLHAGPLSMDELLESALEMIQEVMQVRDIGVFLKDETGNLMMSAAKGYCGDPTEKYVKEDEGICGRAFSTGRAILVQNPASNTYACKFEKELQAASLLAVPLVSKGETLGVLWVASEEVQLDHDSQIRLIMVANQLAISVQNCLLSKKISQLYLDAIRALLRAVEYYHPSARGHSERVASYSVMLAKSMDLPLEEVETIRSAALLHDIGRTGHFETLYRKPDGLTEEDWKQIFTPLKYGLKILEPLAGQFPILPILYHFYERYDGRGFPDGLKGENIPAGSRILAIANAFDDISANAPQLGEVSLVRAIEELKKEAGTLFDPGLVKLFVRSLSHLPAEELVRGI